MASNNKANNKNKQAQSNKGNKPSPKIRTTIDDPENDIFDDEIFDDDSIVPKEKSDEREKFEKPW